MISILKNRNRRKSCLNRKRPDHGEQTVIGLKMCNKKSHTKAALDRVYSCEAWRTSLIIRIASVSTQLIPLRAGRSYDWLLPLTSDMVRSFYVIVRISACLSLDLRTGIYAIRAVLCESKQERCAALAADDMRVFAGAYLKLYLVAKRANKILCFSHFLINTSFLLDYRHSWIFYTTYTVEQSDLEYSATII